jgi:hypothetical protein
MKKFLVMVLLVLALLAWFGYRAARKGDVSSAPEPTDGATAQPDGTEASARVVKPEESAEQRAEIERQTSSLRGLPFKAPVTYKMIERGQLKAVLEKMVEEQYTERELRDYSRSLAAMGLVPDGTDVLRVLMGLYGEQVAAFYVPEEHALYTFQDQAWTGSMDRMLLSHELVHALQDQHFDVGRLPLKLKTNDDKVLATSALVEGDATVLMTYWYANHADLDGALQDLLAAFGQNTQELAKAPEHLRESLIFPYQEGQRFVAALVQAGGMEAVNKVFAAPPTSTEQILHPEKFLGDRDDPVEVELTGWKMDGWRLIGDNVLGEFGVRGLLKSRVGLFDARVAAQGWEGDRYHVYEHGENGPLGVVWESVWETEADARELVAAYRKGILEPDGARGYKTEIVQNHARVVVLKSLEPGFIASGLDWLRNSR